MALKITRISLTDFRGYKRLTLDDISDLVIIVGPNAVGKTNIIEALQLLTATSSFRNPSWSETISWGHENSHASIDLKDEKRDLEHAVHICGNKRTYEVNGKKKNAPDLRGVLPCVLFIPDDLQLIKASSVKRRDAIDALAVQLSKNYSTLKNEYQQALKQRNLLIKEGIHEGSLFDSWDESMAVHGARLCLSRWRLFDRLIEHMKNIYSQIVPSEQIDAMYLPSWERFDEELHQLGDTVEPFVVSASSEASLEEIKQNILDASQKLKEKELARQSSLIGPHRDDISFFIQGKNARMFASQGQQRTLVLAFKLASVELVHEILGSEPVLLLDDVMSELDEKHRAALMSFIEKGAQTFITTTNLDYFSDEIIKNAQVIRVPIEDSRYEY